MKKRAKKIKTRMSSRAAEFEANLGQPNAKIIDAPNKAKIGKSIRDIDKLLGNLLIYCSVISTTVPAPLNGALDRWLPPIDVPKGVLGGQTLPLRLKIP